MATKKAVLALLMLCSLASAYNVSKTYYLNESGGYIIDEAVTTLKDNTLLTYTLSGLIITIIVIFMGALPIILLLGIIYLLLRGKQ